MLGATAGSASAQTKPVVNAGIDFPTVYFFRGIRQEVDPKFTTFVFGDVGFPVPRGRHGRRQQRDDQRRLVERVFDRNVRLGTAGRIPRSTNRTSTQA